MGSNVKNRHKKKPCIAYDTRLSCLVPKAGLELANTYKTEKKIANDTLYNKRLSALIGYLEKQKKSDVGVKIGVK